MGKISFPAYLRIMFLRISQKGAFLLYVPDYTKLINKTEIVVLFYHFYAGQSYFYSSFCNFYFNFMIAIVVLTT